MAAYRTIGLPVALLFVFGEWLGRNDPRDAVALGGFAAREGQPLEGVRQPRGVSHHNDRVSLEGLKR